MIFSKSTVFLTLWILKLLLKEHDLFFLADLSNALELGYYIISDVCRFLPFQSYFQLWKSKHKKDTLEVQRQSFSSYSFGLWKVTALWRHFTRCQEIQFFEAISKNIKKSTSFDFWLSPTFWQPPSSHQQLYATWKFGNVISDNRQKASMMWTKESRYDTKYQKYQILKENGCCATNPWDFPGFFDPDFSSASFASRATRSSS